MDKFDAVEWLPLGLSRQEAALMAVLLFHDAAPWDTIKQAVWLKLTGSREDTPKVLCDTVRASLKGGVLA